MSHLCASDDQNTGVSVSASVLAVNIQGLISLKMNWFDVLAVQGIFRSLLQHHSSKASILWCYTFFMVQLLKQYMTTGKSITLITQTFVGRVMHLLFNSVWVCHNFPTKKQLS